jgi:CheY-like chemotaxis protein
MNVSGSALAFSESAAAIPATVLVADDDPTSRILVGAALEGHVRGVVDAENGLEAVQAMERQSFDIAILDLDMPVMDGFGVIERARLRPETRHLPIIVVTGRDDVVAIERAFALGATSFLCKPINWNIFRHQVGYVLQVARVERETRAAKDRAERLASFRASGLAALEKEIAATATKISSLSDDAREETLGEILQTGQRLQGVLRRVKRTSDILTDNGIFEPALARASDVALAAIHKIEATLGAEASSRIDFSGCHSLEVECDRSLAADALAEVLENALAFSPSPQRVRMGIVAASDGRVRYEIEDRGPGIPEHILERGFESFRSGSGASGARMGLGLGLPTARMIVERHGGHFAMMSEVGRGTEVFLSFPGRPAGIVVKSR